MNNAQGMDDRHVGEVEGGPEGGNAGQGKRVAIRAARRRRMEKQNRLQALLSFAMMLSFTIFAFLAVRSPEVPGTFASFFIMLLASMQVLLQLVIFMHLKERGSAYPIFFIITAVIFAVAILVFIIHVRSL